MAGFKTAMILSASRRTDIPAFYSDWFYHRIEQGFVYVRNPMNSHQISKILLNPEVVDCFVFWTKNPKPFIDRLFLLNNYSYYFQYTITGYGKTLEPTVPPLQESLSTFIVLSKRIGSKAVVWRYDPILISDTFTEEYHCKTFEYIASQLSDYTDSCVISFVYYYKKTIKNLSNINNCEMNSDTMKRLAQKLQLIGLRYNITITSCSEEIDLSEYGIAHGKCIDHNRIEAITGFTLQREKDKNQRATCECISSIDIGSYNSCSHGCLYCYANENMILVSKNVALHYKYDALLFGTISDDDRVTYRKMISCKIR
jgi:DNA repair photolyase